METLKKLVDFLARLPAVARWIAVIGLAVSVSASLIALSSCSVSTRLTGVKTTIDTTHYVIHSYSKNYDKNR